MITVGGVVGGPECTFFDARVRRFSTYCFDMQTSGTLGVEINIAYHLPGSVIKPDYVGLRIGRFSMGEKSLMVQVAVEDAVIACADERKVLQYIYETADEALGLAQSELEKQGVQYNLERDRQLLDSWKETEMSRQ